MDLAVFSPRKLQMFNQNSPRISAHKRSLFPSSTGSPQDSDLGHISELTSSDDSDTYSPSPLSPSSSITPEKSGTRTFGKILQISDYSEFGNCSPPQKAQDFHKRSPKMLINKENIPSIQNSVKKSSKKKFLNKDNFEDQFETILPDSSEAQDLARMVKYNSANFTPPMKTTMAAHNKEIRKSPRSPYKPQVTLKPNSFYGSIAPVLATNQTNRIQGMKCIFRPVQPKAKAKLLFEEKPAKKRERSKSLDVSRESKRRKTLFTGVNHAIRKPVKSDSLSSSENDKKVSIREKARKLTDLSRTPYGQKKNKTGWEYTLRFTKPLRYDEDLGSKRKFFKTSVKEGSVSPGSSDNLTPTVPKKRKLLDSRQVYLQDNSPQKVQFNHKEMTDMMQELDTDKLQNSIEVDDILLRLEEDDGEEKKREAEKQMLMNILEDSPNKTSAIDSLSNITASLDLNEPSTDSGCSQVTTLGSASEEGSPRRLFSIFSSPSNSLHIDASSRQSSSKKKWKGVGKTQMQIDAGQKQFGACQCHECGMIYQLNEAEDESEHAAFHNNLSTLRHQSWKNENVVGAFGIDYALVVTSNDPKSWQQKAQDVISLVDKSLGVLNETPSMMHNQKVFMYISEKRIVGCMVACPVTRAYKMEGSESDVNLCSEESFPVRCGISRMWTLYSHRRRGVATRLLDTVRCNFMYGHILPKEDIAFSIPTPDGKRFAEKYMNTPNFFVYTGY